MYGPVILSETGDIDMSSNGIDIFEYGSGRLELHCDIATSVPSADVYLQLQDFDADGPVTRYVDATNAPPVIHVTH